MSRTVKGILWSIATAFWISVSVAIVRYLADSMHPFQMLFIRNVMGFVVVSIWCARFGIEGIKTKKISLHAARAGVAIIAMSSWFYVLAVIPLPEANALSFTVPLFSTLGAIMLLKEQCGWHRLIALILGFLGTLPIIKPGTEVFTPLSLIAIVAAIFWSGSNLLTKQLAKTESTKLVVFYLFVFGTIFSLPMALVYWQTPSLEILYWIAAMSLATVLSHVCVTNAFANADVSLVVPFDFTRLVFVSIIAYIFFGELIDIWTSIGAIMIFASTVYMIHREEKYKKIQGEKYESPV